MEAVPLIAVLIASVVVHEVAHAWQARREGDDTADKLGRITLNPVSHLDLMGSVIVPLVLHFSGSGFLFGWAKPVPVNPANYRSPVWGDIRVSMAGIVSNLILAAFSTLLLAVVLKIQSVSGSLGGTTTLAGQVAYYGILINLVLAFFNLIPLPPLDGSHVLYHALPKALAERYRAAGRHGLLIMMGLLFFFPGVFRYLMWPVSVLMGLATDFARLWL
ncbi:MAG TPA: site-2 protease family protein [Gemmatimonadetes bacterium]|jgi:Zn-dependent protease|nr:site-2 protease family protein [Gemmatimonadota bacterium]